MKTTGGFAWKSRPLAEPGVKRFDSCCAVAVIECAVIDVSQKHW